MIIGFESAAEYWAAFTENAAGIRQKIDALPPDDRARLRALVDEGSRAFMRDGRLDLSATALCASARRPPDSRS